MPSSRWKCGRPPLPVGVRLGKLKSTRGSVAAGRPSCPLDHAAAGPRAPGEGVPRDNGDHGADRRGDDRADVERAVDRVHAEERAGKEAADQGAHDAEHDVADDAQALVATDEEAGQVAGYRAE